MLLRNFVGRLMGLVAMIVLARELSPYEFGLVTISDVLLRMVAAFAVSGIAEYVMAYRGDDEEAILKAAFWLNSLLTAVVVGGVAMSAPFWAVANGDDRIVSLAILLAAVFVVTQLGVVPKAILARRLDFRTQVRIQTPFVILVPIGKIVAVYSGLGVFSLVVPTLILAPFQSLAFFVAARWTPGNSLLISRWATIFAFTKFLVAKSILTRAADFGDKIVLAQFLSLEAVGVYGLAYTLMELIPSNLVSVTNNVLSAALPRYAHDKDLFYQRYMQFLQVLAFFVVPTMLAIGLCAEPLILLLYGPKWEAAVLPLQVLTIYGVARCLLLSYGSVLNSLQLPQRALMLKAVYTPFHLGVAAIGAMTGVVGFAAAMAVAKIGLMAWGVKQMMDALEKPFISYFSRLGMVFGAGIGCLAPAIAAERLLEPVHRGNLWATASILALSYALSYLFAFRWLGRTHLADIGEFFGRSNEGMEKVWNRTVNR